MSYLDILYLKIVTHNQNFTIVNDKRSVFRAQMIAHLIEDPSK